MYRGFNLKLDDSIFSSNREKNNYCNIEKEYINKNLGFQVYLEHNSLNGNEIMEQWFPIPESNYHIFLSHSHNDRDLALAIAGKLREEHNLMVFIDSLIWGDCNQLLKIIDDKFCKQSNSLYDYDKRNYSTAHIHLMLMTSLNLMIDRCEVLFFLNTPNSISVNDTINNTTNSPWIFSEIQTSQIIRKKTPERLLTRTKFFSNRDRIEKSLNESMSPQLQIEYQTELNHLKELNTKDFNNWIEKSYISPNDALDNLYKMYPLENIKFKTVYTNFY